MFKNKIDRLCPICHNYFIYVCLNCSTTLHLRHNSSNRCSVRDNFLNKTQIQKVASRFKAIIELLALCFYNFFRRIIYSNNNNFNNAITTYQVNHQTNVYLTVITNPFRNWEKNLEEQNTYKKFSTQMQTFLRGSFQDTQIGVPCQVKEKKSLLATIINCKKAQDIEVIKDTETYSTTSFNTESGDSTRPNTVERRTERTPSKEESINSDYVTSTPRPKSFLRLLFQKARSKNVGTTKIDSADLEGVKRDNRKHCQRENNAIMLYFNNSFPTSYISGYNVKMVNGIAELQDIISNLCESENYMIQCIKKYISDENFKKQLLQTSCQYFSMQGDSKTQATSLVNEMWLNQLEVTKLHEKNLLKKLDFVVRQNRMLQKELEVLKRTYERSGVRLSLGRNRFSHANSSAKTFSKHIIDNNKELQKKVQVMVEVIENLEGELQRLQTQTENLEDENRSYRSNLQNIAAALERTKINTDLQITFIERQTNNLKQILDGSGEASKDLVENLKVFEQQVNNIPFTIRWPKLQYYDDNLPQLIGQCKNLISDFVKALITAHNNSSLIINDTNKLRENNTRLQEHLKKSTDELNCLTRKFEDLEKPKYLESKSSDFQQEINALKKKLKQSSEKYENLTKEFERKNKMLEEYTFMIENSTAEKTCLRNQIEGLINAMSQSGAGDVVRELVTSQEKLEYFHLQYIQESTDKKHLLDKCAELEEENVSFVENQQTYIQQYAELQEALDFLTGENTLLKDQFESEHQTVITLQGERVKYLEEKNILRTIFQHLKTEISRIQQLEGTIADMNSETSRLTLIAEYNKQLGEKLKSEVEIRDTAIMELRNNVQKLNDIQLDHTKDKISLCAKISQISSVKDQLDGCLKREVQKNEKLDETKRLIEVDTENRVRLIQEMQKNERVALKKLLKNFRIVVKQRDGLLKINENCVEENAELKNNYRDQMALYEGVQQRLEEREKQIIELNSKLQYSDSMLKNFSDRNGADIAKTEKCTRQLERMIKHMTKEKEEIASSNDYLKKNMQKLHNDLNEAREQEKNSIDLLKVKSAEFETIKEELNRCKNELQNSAESNIKLTSELDYLHNIYENHFNHFQSTLDQHLLKDQDMNNSLKRKQEEVDSLNELTLEQGRKISILEEKVKFLCNQREEQDKTFQYYETQIKQLADLETTKLKLEEELNELQVKYETNQLNLDKANREIDNLNDNLSAMIMSGEDEDFLYKNRVDEIFTEYNKEKTHIEREIQDISIQLQEVTDTLKNERFCNQELSQSHERLKAKLHEVKNALSKEISLHKDTCCKLTEIEESNKILKDERETFQQQIHIIMVEMSEEKDAYNRLALQNEDMLRALECGGNKFNALVAKNILLENELRQREYQFDNEMQSKEVPEEKIWKYSTALEEQNKELQELKNLNVSLGKELEESRKELDDLKNITFNNQHQATELEFKNCELTLQLHELEVKYETERNMCLELENQNQQNLCKIMKLQEDFVVASGGET